MAKTPMLERKVASAAQSLEDGEASLAEASAMLAAKQSGVRHDSPPAPPAGATDDEVFASYLSVERTHDRGLPRGSVRSIAQLPRGSGRAPAPSAPSHPALARTSGHAPETAGDEDVLSMWTRQRHTLDAQLDRIEQLLRASKSDTSAHVHALAEEKERLESQVASLKQQLARSTAANLDTVSKTASAHEAQLAKLRRQLAAAQHEAAGAREQAARLHVENKKLAAEAAHFKARAADATAQLKRNEKLVAETVAVADSLMNKSARLHALEASSYHSDSSFAEDVEEPSISGRAAWMADAPVVGQLGVAKW